MTGTEPLELPYPEPAIARFGAPAAAALLTVALLGAVLLMAGGGPPTVVVLVAVVLQVVLILARGLALHRAVRAPDAPFRAHQFLFLWSGWVGLNVLLDRRGTPWVDVVVGLLFAAFLTGVFVAVERFDGRR